MGPTAFMTTADNIMFKIAKWAGGIQILYHLFGFYEFLPNNNKISWIGRFLCDVADNEIFASLCENFFFLFSAINEAQLNV